MENNNLSPLSDLRGFTRLSGGWQYVAAGIYYKDSDHGGRTGALAAALLERYKRELLSLTITTPPALFHSKGSKTGLVGISSRKASTGDEYWAVAVNHIPNNSTLLVSQKTFGEKRAFSMAVQMRHWYCHYFYGDKYHQKRSVKGTDLPTDKFLESHGITPIPDFDPAIPDPEQRDSPGDDRLWGIPVDPDRMLYEQIELPRTQGVSYNAQQQIFTATPPPSYNGTGRQRSFATRKYGERAAYANAVEVRHRIMSETYGERYHQLRAQDGNIMPDDDFLRRFGITP